MLSVLTIAVTGQVMKTATILTGNFEHYVDKQKRNNNIIYFVVFVKVWFLNYHYNYLTVLSQLMKFCLKGSIGAVQASNSTKKRVRTEFIEWKADMKIVPWIWCDVKVPLSTQAKATLWQFKHPRTMAYRRPASNKLRRSLKVRWLFPRHLLSK